MVSIYGQGRLWKDVFGEVVVDRFRECGVVWLDGWRGWREICSGAYGLVVDNLVGIWFWYPC